MEHKTPLPLTPFDTLVTSPTLQMMKLMLPYLPVSYQRFLGFYIKFTELKNTLRYFQDVSSSSQSPFKDTPMQPARILEDLKPYLGKESETLDMLLTAIQMMNMMDGTDMPDFSDLGDLGEMMELFNKKEGAD